MASALIQGVRLSDINDSTIFAPDADLNQPVELTIHLNESKISNPGIVFIPGTGITTVVDSHSLNEGVLVIKDIPMGNYSEMIFLDKDSIPQNLIRDSIQLITGQNKILGPFHLWRDSIEIQINTSHSGANLQDNVHQFPLLIRLDTSRGSIFHNQESFLSQLFSQVKNGGEDIRFSKSDGIRPFPYQIERWDSESLSGIIWVLVDTIFSQSENQSLKMYWNNPSSDSKTGNRSVFTSDNGYNGVWHFEEERNSSPGGYTDGSENHNHVTGYNLEPKPKSPCIIGNCPDFDGEDDYLVIPNNDKLDMGSSFYVSIWLKWESDAVWQSFPRILDRKSEFKEKAGWTLSIGPHLDTSLIIVGADSLQGFASGPNYWSHGNWEHLAINFQDSLAVLFINGSIADSVFINPIKDNDRDLFIGQYPGEYKGSQLWNGKMDELRLSRENRSISWIKLCYENQKLSSRVLTIK